MSAVDLCERLRTLRPDLNGAVAIRQSDEAARLAREAVEEISRLRKLLDDFDRYASTDPQYVTSPLAAAVRAALGETAKHRIGYFSDPRRGIRAMCQTCGWSGPWREGNGFALERDVAGHSGGEHDA